MSHTKHILIYDDEPNVRLISLLHESLGEHHASYHSYKAALSAECGFKHALNDMRWYCERFGIDFQMVITFSRAESISKGSYP